jgi:DNA repair exonuclease SbcCD ATPase subunit
MGAKGIESATRGEFEDEVDALFQLPLAEFTGARNDLAARLKRAGHADDAVLVKAFAKPSITAWAVNQLHWKHREALDRLLVTGQRVRQAQTSQPAGRIADIRGSLDARSEALSHLSDLASELLRDAGHNPTPDTIHRITTTLEAISGYASPSNGPTLGRLTQDVDPPGFESLASLISGTNIGERKAELSRVTPSPKPARAGAEKTQKASSASEIQKVRRAEETRRATIAAAKAALQEARKSLTEARSTAQRLETAQKKADAATREADADSRRAEKQLREAEQRFKKASTASQDAADRAQRIEAEAADASQAVERARRAIEDASKELESLLKESG